MTARHPALKFSFTTKYEAVAALTRSTWDVDVHDTTPAAFGGDAEVADGSPAGRQSR